LSFENKLKMMVKGKIFPGVGKITRLVLYLQLFAFFSFLIGMGIWSFRLQEKKLNQTNQFWQQTLVLLRLHKLQKKAESVQANYSRIDIELPGISTASADFFLSQYRAAIRNKELRRAAYFIEVADRQSKAILAQQNLIIPKEVQRLEKSLDDNLREGEEIFAVVDDIKQDLERLRKRQSSLAKLKQLRRLMFVLAGRLAQRRQEMAEAEKKIVVVKSDLRVYMYENDKLIHTIPVSLGRQDHETRSGEFKILDKIEKAWGYYQIWMPYWMGIYFAGSSENGFHGIPWDSAGVRYWEKDIGKNNVTYGCIMADDKEMRRLYNWAEVGTKVIIQD